MFIHCSNVNVPKIWMAWFWLRAVTYFEPLQYVTTLLQALQPFPWPNLIPSFGPAFFVSHLPRSQYTTAIDPPLLKPSWWSRRHQHWLSCLSRDLLEHFWSAVMLLAMAQTLVRQPWEQRLCGKSLFKKKNLCWNQFVACLGSFNFVLFRINHINSTLGKDGQSIFWSIWLDTMTTSDFFRLGRRVIGMSLESSLRPGPVDFCSLETAAN